LGPPDGQFRDPPVDRQLVLQLGDASARSHQLRVISAGHPRNLTAVEQLLPPRIGHLRADIQIMRDLSDRSARSLQIENLPPELRRVTPRRNVLRGLPDG
jgi:hypothetical protein